VISTRRISCSYLQEDLHSIQGREVRQRSYQSHFHALEQCAKRRVQFLACKSTPVSPTVLCVNYKEHVCMKVKGQSGTVKNDNHVIACLPNVINREFCYCAINKVTLIQSTNVLDVNSFNTCIKVGEYICDDSNESVQNCVMRCTRTINELVAMQN
jgi:hypothetical protein